MSRIASPPHTRRDRDAVVIGTIFVGALAIRLLYVASVRGAFFFEHLQTEPLRYHRWALRILDGRASPAPPFDEPPGYPYAIAALYRLFGPHVGAVAIVQAVLDATTCALIAVAGRRVFGAAVGAVAGTVAALYGPLVYFTGQLEPATAFVCAVTAAIAAAVVGVPWLLVGGLWAAALLLRAEVVLALPFAALDAWRRGGRAGLGGVAAPAVLLLGAVMAVNTAHVGRLVLFTTGGGMNLWLGNNPHADGVSPFVSEPLEPVMRDVAARTDDPAEADALFRQRTFAFWRDHPRAALGLLWKKFLWTWTARELPNSADIAWQTGQSWLFRLPVVPLGFGAVLPLALGGGLLLGSRWRELPLLWAPLAAAIGTCVLFFTNARFRLVMAPSLIVLAAVALARFASMVRRRRWEPLTVLLLVAGGAIGLVVTRGDFYGLRAYRIPEITVNTGILEREAGHLPAAVRLLRDGLHDNPHDALAWAHLALAFEQLGDSPAALRTHLDALAALPTDPSVRQDAGRFLARQGIDPSALGRYLAAPTPAARAAIAAELLTAATRDRRRQ